MGYLDRLCDLDITDSEAQLRAVTRFYSLPLLVERELLGYEDFIRCIKDAIPAEHSIAWEKRLTPEKILWILQDLHMLVFHGEATWEDRDGLAVGRGSCWKRLQQLHGEYVRSVTLITLKPVQD